MEIVKEKRIRKRMKYMKINSRGNEIEEERF